MLHLLRSRWSGSQQSELDEWLAKPVNLGSVRQGKNPFIQRITALMRSRQSLVLWAFLRLPFANSEGITSRTKQMVWPQEGAQAATRANRRSCAVLLSLLSQAFVPEYKSDESLRLPLAIDGSERNKYRKVSEPVMNSLG